MRFILAILIVFFSSNCFAFWTKGTDTAPEVQTFCKRVLDDGGTVVDVEYMDKTVKLLKQLGVWSNVKFLGDANFGVKLNGSGVTKFYDLSGNNNDATQGTVANQPVWTAAVHNGKYGLVYDATDYMTLGTVIGNPASFSFVVVLSKQDISIGRGPPMAAWDGGTLGQVRNIEIGNTGQGDLAYYFADGTNQSNGYTAAGLVSNNTVFLWVATYLTTENYVRMFKDAGSELAVTKVRTAATTNAGGTVYDFTLGSTVTDNLYLIGSMMTNLVFNTALTTAHRTAIKSFLNAYYSIY